MVWPDGLMTSYAPLIPAASPDRTKVAMSRASTYCNGLVGTPGATTRPPAAIRCSHHGNRPMSSRGPRINPALASNASGKDSRTASSGPAFGGRVIAVVIGGRRCGHHW